MVTRAEVRAAIGRMAGVWPALARRDAMRQEIGNAVMRHADKLQPDDLARGMDELLARARGVQDDGGPASPPGPHEVVGCILRAKDERVRDTPTPARPSGITFSEWWSSLSDDERAKHDALRKVMTGDGITEGMFG